ncbi:MAG: hypothetical protein Q4G47_07935 [Lachnospiraceae bacterium]|nr:hypothetical protein [Lachnospiraceae bacterium]
MAKKYTCKNCGAELFFDPKTGKLHCDYCDSDFDPALYDMTDEEAEKTDSTIEYGTDGEDDTVDAKSVTDDSVSLDDLAVFKCPHCGAEIITSKKTVATSCVYCNRAITLTGNVSGDFRPDYVLPFKKEREEVEEAYRALCRKSFLTPKLFSSEATVKKIKGMYVPYWLYSFSGAASVNVRGENLRVYRVGDEEITEISAYRVHEEGACRFERVPADAMKEMDNAMMDSIEPFDMSNLTKFNPAYLTGFYTQRWDETSGENEMRAKDRAKAALREEVLSHTGTFTNKSVEKEQYAFDNMRVEQVMLPVWMMYTEYKGKNYVFGMNGQTGKMMGEIPKDPTRIITVSLGAFLISQIVLLILRLLGVMI